MKTKIYNNDFEYTKFILNNADPSFIIGKVGIKKDHIAKLRKSENIESKTIFKFLDIQKDCEKMDLSSLELKFMEDKDFLSFIKTIPEWSNKVLMRIENHEDLLIFTNILMSFNINPEMVRRLQSTVLKGNNKIVEHIYSKLYPKDLNRNLIGALRSFSLHDTLVDKISKDPNMVNYFEYSPEDLMVGRSQYINGKIVVISPTLEEVKISMARQILSDIKNRDHIAEEMGELPHKDFDWVLANLTTVDPLLLISYAMVEQGIEFSGEELEEEHEVVYSDGSVGYETIGENQRYVILEHFGVSKISLPAGTVVTLLDMGFEDVGERLVFKFKT